MTSYVPPKKNDANGWIGYVSLAPKTPNGQWQANPTLASGDVKIAIDDGAPANLGTLPAVDADFTKRVKIVLSQAETNGDNLTIIFSDAAGDEWCDLTINLQTTARQVDDLAFPNTSGRGIDVTAGGEVGLDWANIGSPTTTVNLSGTTVKTATDVATDTVAIKAKTDNLPSDPADASVIAGRFDTVDAALTAIDDFVDTEVAAIKAKTDNLPTDPADQSLIIAATDAIMTRLGTPADTDIATDIANVQTAVDAVPTAGDTADAVWEETLADHSGTAGSTAEQLAAAGAAGDPWATALPGSYTTGQAGKIVGDNLNATVSSRATQTSVDDIPTNAELATALAAADDAVLAALAILDGKVDDILEDTGTTLSDTLADILTILGTPADTDLATDVANAQADITTIKNVTDGFSFTLAGLLDVNLQAVNDQELTGDGSGTPWGPA